MLKKLSHIILSLLLLISTMGMAVSKHYCGENLVSVSLFESSSNVSCCDMDNCCHNETQLYQVKEDFSVPAISTVPVLAELDILGHDLFHLENLKALKTKDATPFVAETPPLLLIQKTLAVKEVYLL